MTVVNVEVFDRKAEVVGLERCVVRIHKSDGTAGVTMAVPPKGGGEPNFAPKDEAVLILCNVPQYSQLHPIFAPGFDQHVGHVGFHGGFRDR